MGVGVAIVLLLVLLAVAAVVAVVVKGARSPNPNETDQPRAQTLRYLVPDGQDPVVVMAELRKAGYDAVTDREEGSTVVVVPCPNGVDRERERVREVIGGASGTTLEGPEFDPGHIIFDDEKSA